MYTTLEIPSGFEDSDSTVCSATRCSSLKVKCSYPNCKLQFRRQDACDRHEFDQHKVPKKHKCTRDSCDKEYVTSSHLRRHVKTAHKQPSSTEPVPDSIKCKHVTCKMRFAKSNHMMNHYKQIHLNWKAFECSHCPERFRRKLQLKRHIVIHTSEYPYICDVCSKGSLNLKDHNRHKAKHNIHKCSTCQAQFPKWSDIVEHRRQCKSKLHVCDICEKSFSNQARLKAHAVVHVEKEKRDVFVCTVEGCTKFYFALRNLTAHCKSKHEGIKFPCTVEGCNAILSTKAKLNSHVKKIHDENFKSQPVKEATKKPRKDKGTAKKLVATALSGVTVSKEAADKIRQGHGECVVLDVSNCPIPSESDG